MKELLYKYGLSAFFSAILLSATVTPAKANEAYELKFDPVPQKLAQYARNSATTYLNQGLQLVQSGRPQDAIGAFNQAIQLDPYLAPAHYNLGLALRQVGQLQQSADAFYRATQVDPKFALAYANLGGALLEGNNLPQAENYLERALELDSKLGFAHYNVGL